MRLLVSRLYKGSVVEDLCASGVVIVDTLLKRELY